MPASTPVVSLHLPPLPAPHSSLPAPYPPPRRLHVWGGLCTCNRNGLLRTLCPEVVATRRHLNISDAYDLAFKPFSSATAWRRQTSGRIADATTSDAVVSGIMTLLHSQRLYRLVEPSLNFSRKHLQGLDKDIRMRSVRESMESAPADMYRAGQAVYGGKRNKAPNKAPGPQPPNPPKPDASGMASGASSFSVPTAAASHVPLPGATQAAGSGQIPLARVRLPSSAAERRVPASNDSAPFDEEAERYYHDDALAMGGDDALAVDEGLGSENDEFGRGLMPAVMPVAVEAQVEAVIDVEAEAKGSPSSAAAILWDSMCSNGASGAATRVQLAHRMVGRLPCGPLPQWRSDPAHE